MCRPARATGGWSRRRSPHCLAASTRRRRLAQSKVWRQRRLAAPQRDPLQPALGLQARRPTRGIHTARPKRLRFLLLNTIGKVVRHARETLLRCTKEIARALAGAPRTRFALKRPP